MENAPDALSLPRETDPVISLGNAPDALSLSCEMAAVAACGGGYIDLSMTVVVIAPASALEEPVRRGDSTKGDAVRKIATPIDYATAELAHIQRFPAGMFACR